MTLPTLRGPQAFVLTETFVLPATAGPDYVIPAGTPFTLTASCSEPDGDQVAYTWNPFDFSTTNRFALGTTPGTAGRSAVNDDEASSLSLYPNPVSSMLHIHRPAGSQVAPGPHPEHDGPYAA